MLSSPSILDLAIAASKLKEYIEHCFSSIDLDFQLTGNQFPINLISKVDDAQIQAHCQNRTGHY
jgi:hypothetical protein